MVKLNKYDRIQVVKDFGLNTEENILVNKNNHLDFLNNLDNCSIRTFRDNDVSTPHYPFISKEEALKIIPSLLNDKYKIILATPINPDNCEFAGAAMINKRQIVVELAYGPGTVRRVTHDGKIDKRYFFNNFYPTNLDDDRLKTCLLNFKKTNLMNVIFEFSWYKNLVGYKKENFICWEITDDGTKKSKLYL